MIKLLKLVKRIAIHKFWVAYYCFQLGLYWQSQVMNHRINLRKFNGHWFMAVGTKGYACTTDFENFLNEVRPSCVFISDSFTDPWFIVRVIRGESVVTEFLEPKSGETLPYETMSEMFEDLDLPTQFYINRGDS